VATQEFTLYLSPLCGWRAVQFAGVLAIAAEVIVITDDSDYGHRLVAMAQAKFGLLFLELVP
jgi:hypothetical protein